MDRSAFVNSVTPEQHLAIAAWWRAFTEAEAKIDGLFSGKDRSFDLVAFMGALILGRSAKSSAGSSGLPLRARVIVWF